MDLTDLHGIPQSEVNRQHLTQGASNCSVAHGRLEVSASPFTSVDISQTTESRQVHVTHIARMAMCLNEFGSGCRVAKAPDGGRK